MQSFTTIANTAMTILLIWGLASLIIGTLFCLRKQTKDQQSFWFMMAAWGFIDSLIALITLQKTAATTITSEFVNAQTATVGFNVVLDVVYIVVGILLFKSAIRRRHLFGKAIIIQGSFLFLFDLVLFSFLSQI
jgi:uncharacterized membrane protein YgcG